MGDWTLPGVKIAKPYKKTGDEISDETGTEQPSADQTVQETSSVPGSIRDWSEDVDGISGQRLRNCIIYQLDVRKADFYVKNMSRGFVRRNAKRLDDDTPVEFVYNPNPLIGSKQRRTEDGKVTDDAIILRKPKDAAERKYLRDQYGVNAHTRRWLAKEDCPKCDGSGLCEVASYPSDSVYARLTDFVECSCNFE